jgi:hypothetical protein
METELFETIEELQNEMHNELFEIHKAIKELRDDINKIKEKYACQTDINWIEGRIKKLEKLQ